MSKSGEQSTSLKWVRFLYFIVYASFGTIAVYRTLFFRRVGLGESQIGVLIAIQLLVMIVAGPVWSLFADWLGIRSRLLTLLTALTILPQVAMVWFDTFPQLVVLSILYALFWSPIQPLMDCTALEVLGDDRDKYATVRAFGSLGYAPVSLVTGILIQGRDIRWTFLGFAALMGIGALTTRRVPSQSSALIGSSASRCHRLKKAVANSWHCSAKTAKMRYNRARRIRRHDPAIGHFSKRRSKPCSR